MDYTSELRKGDWDLLIVLDACRADIFDSIYQDYFPTAKLTKAVSPASHTMEWLNKVWLDEYPDTIYISANPYISSTNEVKDAYGNTYDAKKHFPVIIDVWDKGWNNELGSVPPEEVNKMYAKVKEILGNGKKRVILHYIQPHEPFIGEKYKKYRIGTQSLFQAPVVKKAGMKSFVAKAIKKVFGVGMIWRISALRGKTGSQYAQIYLAEGWDGVRAAYTENLCLALDQVIKITNNFQGKVVITADHGDFLGEHGLFGHPDKVKKKENTEIPWLEI